MCPNREIGLSRKMFYLVLTQDKARSLPMAEGLLHWLLLDAIVNARTAGRREIHSLVPARVHSSARQLHHPPSLILVRTSDEIIHGTVAQSPLLGTSAKAPNEWKDVKPHTQMTRDGEGDEAKNVRYP